MDSPPVISGGRTLVPIRFISESLGLVVNWDSNTMTVIVNTPGNAGQSGLEQIYGADNSACLGTWVNDEYGTAVTFTANGRCEIASDGGSVWGTYKINSDGIAEAMFEMEETVYLYYKVADRFVLLEFYALNSGDPNVYVFSY